MHYKTKFNIISFYEFINLTEIEQLKSELIHFLKKRNSKGTILLAKEGLNGTISIKKNYSLEEASRELNFKHLHIKYTKTGILDHFFSELIKKGIYKKSDFLYYFVQKRRVADFVP